MSGQWEVVGKNKKNAQNEKAKVIKDDKLPVQQTKLENNGEHKEPKIKPPKEGKTENKKSGSKKQNEKKHQDPPKSKIPKSIDNALKQENYLNDLDTKVSSTLPELLKRLPTSTTKGANSTEITASILKYFKKDSNSLAIWKQNYGKYTRQSVYLLNHIKKNWNESKKSLKLSNLTETLKEFQKYNNDLLSKSKKKDDTLQESNRVCQDILDKMSRSRGFPWFWANFLLFSVVIAVLVYDSNQKGSFEKSTTGQFLKDIGAYETTQRIWLKSLSASARGYVWLENNAPYYYNSTVEFSKPYAAFARDLAIVGTNAAKQAYSNVKDYAVEKTPIVTNAIEQYAPGLIENIQGYTSTAWIATRDFTVHYYTVSVDYLQTKVFIDDWAPEALKIKTLRALNVTQIYAARYYDWFHKQVDVYSKIK